jgi:DNA/RNA-binding domain of Phe-tRNA-synthetase-like protein
MKFVISEKIKEKFPDLRIGYLVADKVDNTGEVPEILKGRNQDLEEILRSKFDLTTLGDVTLISLWRDIYLENGSKPNKFLPTVEALLKRVLKGNNIPIINKAVNSYLIAELKTLLPIGGYDIETLEGDIVLDFSEGHEMFSGFGSEDELTFAGEIVYSDAKSVLTRRWNYRDAVRTQITENSTKIILMTETPNAQVSNQLITETLEEMKKQIFDFCGGEIQTGILDVNLASEIEF